MVSAKIRVSVAKVALGLAQLPISPASMRAEALPEAVGDEELESLQAASQRIARGSRTRNGRACGNLSVVGWWRSGDRIHGI